VHNNPILYIQLVTKPYTYEYFEYLKLINLLLWPKVAGRKLALDETNKTLPCTLCSNYSGLKILSGKSNQT